MRRTTHSVRSVLATAILLLPLCLTSPVRRKRAVSGPPCDTLDLAFLMDLSGTTSDAELTAMKGFVRDVGAFVTMSSADTNVALISFDDSATTIVEFPGYTSKTDFDNDVGGLTTTSKTAMESLGLDAARASLGVSRSTAPNVVVFVTTSEPTKATASSTAWLIEADDGLVITVAVGSDPTNSNLYTTASTPDHFFSVADENGLSDSAFLDKISTTLCEAAKEDNCATSPCQNGGVCIDLPGQYRCECPPEYGGFSCEFLCGKADIGILSDASGSVKSTNWHNNVVPFHLLLLDKLNIDPSGDEVRVGHVTFSKTSAVDFKLNTYFDRVDMQNNIDAIDYDNKYKSSTFTALGLETLRTGVFTGKESDGDRARVPNIALVFTDGGSNMEAHRTGSEAAELHKHTDQTFSLGVSTGINITEVNLIADDLSRALYALDFTVMDTFIETIKKGICERSSYPAQKCMDVDMGFVMDSSLSVTQANWDRMNQFVKDILNHPVNVFGPTNTLVGRVDYSLTSTTIHHLDTYTDKQSIIDAQNSPWLKQLTFTHEGFRLMREDILNPANGERANNRNIVTLVTDGPSNRPSETETEAAALRAVADVYAFGVAGYDPIELLKIVGGDASKVMVAPTFDDLTNAVDLFINGICGNRTNSPCDNPNQCSNGGTCINSAASSGFSCVCPPGYSGSTCGTPTVCTSMDIMYVCDESSSVKQENWTRMTNALADYLDVPVFRRDYAQLGFVEFGIAAEITLALGEYEFGQDLQEQIRQRTYSQGLTYTHEGIKKMMDAFNNPLYDAARTALNPPKVGFIITDGPSTRKSETLIEAETARNAGVDLYVLGVGDGVDYAELEAVSNDVAKVVLASDYSVIGPASNFLHDALCGYNRDDKCNPSPCKNGAKCFNYFSGSSNPVAGYKCVCATGYSGVNCDQEICDTIDLTFVVEDTTVIRPNEFIKVKEALIAATDSSISTFANSNLRVVTYGSGSATAELDWTAFGGHSNKIDAIQQLPSRWVKTLETGMTYAISSYPSGSTNKKVMVMVVDQYTIYPSRIAQVAALAKAEHIELYALGIDIVMPKAIMDIVGSNSTGHALMVNGFSEAITGLPLLVKAICGDNTYLNPCQGVTCNGKGACVPGLNSYQCACDPGFGGQTCGDTQCYKADLAFVLDSSASLGDENWKSLLYYVSNATRGLDVRTGGTQIGCVSYGYFHRMVFSLNAYHDHGDLGDALVNIAYDRGLTMTDFGISDLYNIVFGTGQGKRTGNEHYGCVITDGRSTKPADTQIQAQEARNQGITMMAIGVKDYDKAELLGIVGGAANNDKVLLIENFDYMTNDIAVNWIRETACGLTRADNPCNTSPCQNGGVCLQHVGSAQNTTYMCDCPSGFTGANCQTQDIPTTCEVADVCVVFDTGVPHTQSDWDSLLHFFNTLSDLRNTGGNSVNFGLYGFNDVETLTIKALGPAQQITSNKPPHFSTTTNSVGLNAALEKCHGSSGHRDNVRYTTLLFTNTPSSSLSKTKEEAQKLRDFGSELFIVSTTLAAYDESVIVAGGTANVTQLNELSDIKYKGKYFNSKLCGLPPPDGRCSGTMMCFLIDVSASLDSHMYSKEIDFVDNVARSQTLGVNDVQVGIVTFGYNTYPKLNAGDGIVQSSIDSVIADLRANQKRELTFIGKGIATARQHCFMNGNSANKKMLMLVTDGTANDAADMGTQAANAKAESNPIEIWALGVGSETDASELRGVASSNDKFIQVSSYDSLVAQYSDIMNLVCG